VHGHSIDFLRVCRADKQIAFANTAKIFLKSGGFLLWIIATSIRGLFLLVGLKARTSPRKRKKEEKRPLALPRPKHASKQHKGFVRQARTDAGLQDAGLSLTLAQKNVHFVNIRQRSIASTRNQE